MSALNFFQKTIASLFPWACAGCRKTIISWEDPGLCERCDSEVVRLQHAICFRCGIPISSDDDACRSCLESKSLIQIRAASQFSGKLISSIYRYKYQNRPTLNEYFSGLLVGAWYRYPELHSTTLVMPIPLHPKQKRMRGYNQAELLASKFCQKLGLSFSADFLQRNRQTRSQTKLNKLQRQGNLKDAFTANQSLKGERILLIDDVCTTGATFISAATALKKSEPESVSGLVLARDF